MEILIYPDTRLHTKCRPVEKDMLQFLLPTFEEMEQLLRDTEAGVGLAATQVGLAWSVFAIKQRVSDSQVQTNLIINPKIVQTFGPLTSMSEGCLSIPGGIGKVLRYKGIYVTWMNRLGEMEDGKVEGFAAEIWQHEQAHLDGRLCIDDMGASQRKRALKKFWEGQNAV